MKFKTITSAISLIFSIHLNAQPTEVPATGLANLRSSSIANGDINNDGRMDVLIAGINPSGDYQCKVYVNNGNSTFTDLGANIISLVDGDIALADFDSDNYLDVAICGRNDLNDKYTKIYRNNKDNTFTEVPAGMQGLYLGSLAWADYDNDGDLDLLICGQDEANVRKTIIYENVGNRTFTEVLPNIPGISRGQATWGDINNDGLLDMALSGLNNSNNYITEIYVNNGNKSFAAHNANLQKLAFTEQHFIDYDNDGDLDFWISGSNSSGTDLIKLYKNNSGNFVEVSTPFNALWNVSASWGDYDADGDADLIYMGLNSTTPTIQYYQNDGSDAFSLVGLSIGGISEGDISWFDFNNDFKLDILVSGTTPGGNKTAVYQNNTATANTAPSAPIGLSAEISGYQANLSWTAGNDIQTPANGLSYHLCIGTSTGNYDILSPASNMATGKSYLTGKGQVKGLSSIIKNLPEGDYFWRVQSIDASDEASAWSSESGFAICNPVNLGSNQEICKQSKLELTAGTVSDVVNWYSENMGLIASNTQNLLHIIGQNDKIRVEVIKPIGCTARDTIEVTALELPVIVLPATSEACYGETIVLTAGLDGETVNWFAQNGTLLMAGKQLDYKVTGNQTIKCEVTTANGCLDSAKVAITYLPFPQASLGADYGVCKYQTTHLQVTGMQKVNWYALPWKLIAANQAQIDINMVSDTNIVAEFFNADNCVNFDTVNISIHQIKWVNAGSDTIICHNTSLTLGGNPSATGGTAPYIYSWTDENNQVFSSESNPVVNPKSNTFYNLQVSDKNACGGSDKITVEINPPSTIDAGNDIELCYGSSANLGGNPTATNSLFPYSYSWWPTNGLYSPNVANPTATPLDTITYRLIVSTYRCAADTDYMTVHVKPLPIITISENINIGFGGSTSLEASGGIYYDWSPSNSLSSANSAQTVASPNETTTYVVIVTAQNECQDQASVTVTVKNDLFIPNLFTPNDDGKNDYFKIYGTGVAEINMIIYNRNGIVVFQTKDVNYLLETGWDGTTKGAKQPQGSYMYVISGRFVDGNPIEYNNNKGTINLMR